MEADEWHDAVEALCDVVGDSLFGDGDASEHAGQDPIVEAHHRMMELADR